MKILVVDDDQELARAVSKICTSKGHIVDIAYDGFTAQNFIDSYIYDVVILDMILPDAIGYELCKKWHEAFVQSKIIILSVQTEILSKVKSFYSGAHDFVSKPFDPLELLARIESHPPSARTPDLFSGNVVLNVKKGSIEYNGATIELSLRQFSIIRMLFERKGEIVTKQELIMIHNDASGSEHAIDSHIFYIRKALKKSGYSNELIRTLRGRGYMVE